MADNDKPQGGGVGGALLKGGLDALAGAINTFAQNKGGGSASWSSPKFNVNEAVGYQRPLIDTVQSELGKETPIREPVLDTHKFDARKIDVNDPLRSLDRIHQDIASWMTVINKNVGSIFTYVSDVKRQQDGKFADIRTTFTELAKRDKALEEQLLRLRRQVEGNEQLGKSGSLLPGTSVPLIDARPQGGGFSAAQAVEDYMAAKGIDKLKSALGPWLKSQIGQATGNSMRGGNIALELYRLMQENKEKLDAYDKAHPEEVERRNKAPYFGEDFLQRFLGKGTLWGDKSSSNNGTIRNLDTPGPSLPGLGGPNARQMMHPKSSNMGPMPAPQSGGKDSGGGGGWIDWIKKKFSGGLISDAHADSPMSGIGDVGNRGGGTFASYDRGSPNATGTGSRSYAPNFGRRSPQGDAPSDIYPVQIGAVATGAEAFGPSYLQKNQNVSPYDLLTSMRNITRNGASNLSGGGGGAIGGGGIGGLLGRALGGAAGGPLGRMLGGAMGGAAGGGGGVGTSVSTTGGIVRPDGQGGHFSGGDQRGVNPQLVDIINEASKTLPPGWTAKIESGVGSRPGGSGSFHPHGLAADVRIYDDKGNMVGGKDGWYQNAQTFRIYEQFAQAAKLVQTNKYPTTDFGWGGYFVNKGPGSYGFADLMHMQVGAVGGHGAGQMAGGTWEGGAQGVTLDWLRRNGGQSVGLGPQSDWKQQYEKLGGQPGGSYKDSMPASGGQKVMYYIPGKSTVAGDHAAQERAARDIASKNGARLEVYDGPKDDQGAQQNWLASKGKDPNYGGVIGFSLGGYSASNVLTANPNMAQQPHYIVGAPGKPFDQTDPNEKDHFKQLPNLANRTQQSAPTSGGNPTGTGGQGQGTTPTLSDNDKIVGRALDKALAESSGKTLHDIGMEEAKRRAGVLGSIFGGGQVDAEFQKYGIDPNQQITKELLANPKYVQLLRDHDALPPELKNMSNEQIASGQKNWLNPPQSGGSQGSPQEGGKAGQSPSSPQSSGQILKGSEYLKAQRQWAADELRGDPELRRYVRGVISHEQVPGERGRIFESMVNRVNYLRQNGYPNLTLKQYLSDKGNQYGGGARFYAPIRDGQINEDYLRREADGPNRASTDREMDAVLSGTNAIGMRTNQGGPSDSGYYDKDSIYSPGGKPGKGAEGYGDWLGGGAIRSGTMGTREWRLQQQRAVEQGGFVDISQPNQGNQTQADNRPAVPFIRADHQDISDPANRRKPGYIPPTGRPLPGHAPDNVPTTKSVQPDLQKPNAQIPSGKASIAQGQWPPAPQSQPSVDNAPQEKAQEKGAQDKAKAGGRPGVIGNVISPVYNWVKQQFNKPNAAFEQQKAKTLAYSHADAGPTGNIGAMKPQDVKAHLTTKEAQNILHPEGNAPAVAPSSVLRRKPADNAHHDAGPTMKGVEKRSVAFKKGPEGVAKTPAEKLNVPKPPKSGTPKQNVPGSGPTSGPGGGGSNPSMGPINHNAEQDSGGAGDRGAGDVKDPDGVGLCSVG